MTVARGALVFGSVGVERRRLGWLAAAAIASVCGFVSDAEAQQCVVDIPELEAIAVAPGVGGLAGGVATGIGSTATGFFQGSTAFLGAPANATANQIDGGVWTRDAFGENNEHSVARVTPTAPGCSGFGTATNLQTTSHFSGTQVGSDLGMFNINGSGWNIHAGLTGGEYWTSSSSNSFSLFNPKLLTQFPEFGALASSTGSVTTNFSVPFLGVYGAVTGPGFLPGDGVFASVLWRHDFWSGSGTFSDTFPQNSFGFVSGSSTSSINGSGNAVTAEVGYTHPFTNGFFVTPSIGSSYTRVAFDSINLGAPFTGSVGPVLSELGRLGLQVGDKFVAGDWTLVPTLTGSVWHEFADPIPASLAVPGETLANASVSRVGTFEQISLGLTAQPTKLPNLTANVHVDYRTGENLTGATLSGGLRYQF